MDWEGQGLLDGLDGAAREAGLKRLRGIDEPVVLWRARLSGQDA